jgi:iron complex transport system permease protein
MSLGIIGLLTMGWIFNILSLGDDEAKALGVDTKKWRKIIIIFATLSSSSITALAGMIGWIGLVSPHIARLIVGFDNRKLVPATALIGATLLLVCDDLARTLGVAEIPLSILTNFIGAPILFFILFKRGKMYYARS